MSPAEIAWREGVHLQVLAEALGITVQVLKAQAQQIHPVRLEGSRLVWPLVLSLLERDPTRTLTRGVQR